MFRFKQQFKTALQPLVDRARSLDGAAREVWLADLRAECPSVVREVEQMLRSDSRASRAPAVRALFR